MLRTRGNYKNNPIHKVLEGIKWEETKKCNKNLKRQQVGTGNRKEQGSRKSARWMNSGSGKSTPTVLHFSSHFALLFFWSLICNAEFDSNSLCLDRLNNFGIISSQKLQNLP